MKVVLKFFQFCFYLFIYTTTLTAIFFLVLKIEFLGKKTWMNLLLLFISLFLLIKVFFLLMSLEENYSKERRDIDE